MTADALPMQPRKIVQPLIGVQEVSLTIAQGVFIMTAETMLAEQKIVVARKGVSALAEAELQVLGRQVPDWKVTNVDGMAQLQHTYLTADFAQALQFANQIGALAEEVNHHPALLIEWGKLTVSWWTHTVRGLHLNDFIMAARCDVELVSGNGGNG